MDLSKCGTLLLEQLMNIQIVITIFNIETKIGRVIYTTYPEQIAEIEDSLDDSEVMFVNEIE